MIPNGDNKIPPARSLFIFLTRRLGIATQFDFPVGELEASGRRSGRGWHVSQDFRDRKNPARSKTTGQLLTGQHLGEDWVFDGDATDSNKKCVYSVANGKITYCGEEKDSKTGETMAGGIVMIRHDLPPYLPQDYVISVYMHLEPGIVRRLSVGKIVHRGELLGTIAPSSENGGFPEHLHLEIRSWAQLTGVADNVPFAPRELSTDRTRLGYLDADQFPYGWLDPTLDDEQDICPSGRRYGDLIWEDTVFGRESQQNLAASRKPPVSIQSPTQPGLPTLARALFRGNFAGGIELVGRFPQNHTVAILLPNAAKPIMGKTGPVRYERCPYYPDELSIPTTLVILPPQQISQQSPLQPLLEGVTEFDAWVAVLDPPTDTRQISLIQVQGSEKDSLEQLALQDPVLSQEVAGYEEGLTSETQKAPTKRTMVARVPSATSDISLVSITLTGGHDNRSLRSEMVIIQGKRYNHSPWAGYPGLFFRVGSRLFYRSYVHRDRSGAEAFSIFEVTDTDMRSVFKDATFSD